jgi:hypothetical protein
MAASAELASREPDIGVELPDGGMNTSLEPLSGELSEPALDLIDP